MRVIHVTDRLWGGGAEVSLQHWLRASEDEAGLEQSVVCLRRDDQAVAIADELPVPVRFAAQRRPGRWHDIRAVRAELRRHDPDVVHAALFRSMVAAYVATARQRIPLVVSITGVVHRAPDPKRTRRARLGGALAHRIRRTILHRRRVTVHAVSDAVAASVSAELGVDPAEIVVVNRGRPDVAAAAHHHRDETRRSLGLASDDFVFVTVGREHPVKRLDTIIRAFETVAASDDTARLVLVGPRNTASADIDEQLARSNARERVTRLGYRTDVTEILCASDCFVFGSAVEGLPGAVVEAMAAERPAVVSNISSVMAVTTGPHQGALVFEVGDHRALADAMIEIRQDPDLAADLAAAGRRRFLEAFGLKRVVAETVELYGLATNTPGQQP